MADMEDERTSDLWRSALPVSYPNGASGLMDVARHGAVTMHLRGDRTLTGHVTSVDGYHGLPVTVTLDGGRVVPWQSIEWFELVEP